MGEERLDHCARRDRRLSLVLRHRLAGGGGGKGLGQKAAEPQEEDVLLQAPRSQVQGRADQRGPLQGQALSNGVQQAQIQALQRIKELQQGVRQQEKEVETSRCDCLSKIAVEIQLICKR